MSGFVEVVIRERRRGRRTPHRALRIELGDGTRLCVGDRVPRELLQDVLRMVLRWSGGRC